MEQTEALSKIYKAAYAPFFGIMLYTALDLNIPSLLQQPKTIPELAELTTALPNKLDRLLMALEVDGYFSFNPETNQWSNNPTTALLVEESLKNLVKYLYWPFKYDILCSFPEWVKSEKSCPELRFGCHYYEGFKNDPELLKTFQGGMQSMTNVWSSGSKDLGISDCLSVLELAGGNGSLMIYIATQYPKITATVLERPEVVPICRKNIENKNLQERISVIEGDMFESVPSGYDCVIIKHALIDWGDDKVKTVLCNIRSALNVGGKLKWLDILGGRNTKNYFWSRVMDIHLGTILNGRVRTCEEVEKLLTECGFRVESIEILARDELINMDMEVNPEASEYIAHAVAI